MKGDAQIEPIHDGLGSIAYKVYRILPNWPSAKRAEAELNYINPRAYEQTPALEAGPAFDAPEIPSPGSGYAELIAQAAHDHAESGGECSALGCALTRDEE